jgi:hypothetical protein
MSSQNILAILSSSTNNWARQIITEKFYKPEDVATCDMYFTSGVPAAVSPVCLLGCPPTPRPLHHNLASSQHKQTGGWISTCSVLQTHRLRLPHPLADCSARLNLRTQEIYSGPHPQHPEGYSARQQRLRHLKPLGTCLDRPHRPQPPPRLDCSGVRTNKERFNKLEVIYSVLRIKIQPRLTCLDRIPTRLGVAPEICLVVLKGTAPQLDCSEAPISKMQANNQAVICSGLPIKTHRLPTYLDRLITTSTRVGPETCSVEIKGIQLISAIRLVIRLLASPLHLHRRWVHFFSTFFHSIKSDHNQSWYPCLTLDSSWSRQQRIAE